MRTSRGLITFILVAVVVLLNLPVPASLRVKSEVRDSVAGYQNVWRVVVNSWSRTFSAFAGARKQIEERQDLLTEVANLEFRLKQLEKVELENAELRRQLEFQESSRYELVLCEVVSRGGSGGWWHTVTLNKGSDDGITVNSAVVTRTGLVGTTISVTDSSCDVLLLYDSNCKVACKFERTGSLGIMRGSGLPLSGDPEMEMLWNAQSPVMQYVSRTEQLIKGDRVVTSGLGGIYPEGLLVGYMKELRTDKADLYYLAEITPAESMRELRYVFVVREEDR